MLLRKIY